MCVKWHYLLLIIIAIIYIPSKMSKEKKALFVCLGNTCRSPLAEAVFKKTVQDQGYGDQWEVDSAGIQNWHEGDRPNWRSLDIMQKYHVPDTNHYARQIKPEDFTKFDFIFGMDESNMRDLVRRAPSGSRAKLLLLGDFDPEGDRIIWDPYCDDHSSGFEKCYQQALRSSKGFLEQLLNDNLDQYQWDS